jgi:hypothetical protein
VTLPETSSIRKLAEVVVSVTEMSAYPTSCRGVTGWPLIGLLAYTMNRTPFEGAPVTVTKDFSIR